MASKDRELTPDETKVREFLSELGDELKKRNILPAQFARLMGVSRQMMAKWMSYRSIMSLDKYFKALRILGIDENNKAEKTEIGGTLNLVLTIDDKTTTKQKEI